MFSKSLPVLFILTVFLVACMDKNKELKNPVKSTTSSDSLENRIDSNKNLKKVVKVIDKQTEKKDIHEKIIAKYGEQWDFCNCVIKNDSINNALEKPMTDKQTDKLMARWEYVDSKCKEMLITPNTTPEQRSKHEWKVKQCLKNAK